MLKRAMRWIKDEVLSDEYEMTALVSFGIGCTLILFIFGFTLYVLP